MAVQSGITIDGLDDLKKTLETVAPREARNLMRSTIHGVASEINKSAKSRVKSKSTTVAKALKAKRKKSPPDKPVSEVVIRYGKTENPKAFIWRFIEYGTGERTVKKTGANVGAMPETPFIRPALEEMRPQIPRILREQFGKKLEAFLKRKAKKAARS